MLLFALPPPGFVFVLYFRAFGNRTSDLTYTTTFCVSFCKERKLAIRFAKGSRGRCSQTLSTHIALRSDPNVKSDAGNSPYFRLTRERERERESETECLPSLCPCLPLFLLPPSLPGEIHLYTHPQLSQIIAYELHLVVLRIMILQSSTKTVRAKFSQGKARGCMLVLL